MNQSDRVRVGSGWVRVEKKKNWKKKTKKKDRKSNCTNFKLVQIVHMIIFLKIVAIIILSSLSIDFTLCYEIWRSCGLDLSIHMLMEPVNGKCTVEGKYFYIPLAPCIYKIFSLNRETCLETKLERCRRKEQILPNYVQLDFYLPEHGLSLCLKQTQFPVADHPILHFPDQSIGPFY